MCWVFRITAPAFCILLWVSFIMKKTAIFKPVAVVVHDDVLALVAAVMVTVVVVAAN